MFAQSTVGGGSKACMSPFNAASLQNMHQDVHSAFWLSTPTTSRARYHLHHLYFSCLSHIWTVRADTSIEDHVGE